MPAALRRDGKPARAGAQAVGHRPRLVRSALARWGGDSSSALAARLIGVREAATRRSKLLARLANPSGHPGFAGAAPRPRVVAALVADPSVHLEHALPVVEHVSGDRARERVLVVGVDV